MKVLVPYFGQTERFRPVLASWWWAFKTTFPAGSAVDACVLTDPPSHGDAHRQALDISGGGLGCEVADPAPFADLIRPGQAFDVKGALVCAWLAANKGPALVLDADAQLQRDPRPHLAGLERHPLSMPTDDGALTHGREPCLTGDFAGTRKRCAGVIWFPAHPGRGRLIAAYRKAWGELRSCQHWSPPLAHLLEQHAWSLVARRRGGGVLPRAMNWSPDHLGENPAAAVYHRYGLSKWA